MARAIVNHERTPYINSSIAGQNEGRMGLILVPRT